MSFVSDVTSVLLEGRRLAESLMTDTCTAKRVTGSTTDPLTGVETPTYTPLYTGRCKVQSADPQEANPVAGGATYTVQRYTVHVPVGAFAVAIGDVFTITAASLDALLVGRTYRVVALLHKTHATAYRLAVEEGP